MASVECLHHGCRRKIAQNSEWGYYCYQHRMDSPEYAEVIRDSIDQMSTYTKTPDLNSPAPAEFYTTQLQLGTPMASDLQEPFSRAVQEWNAEKDHTIPKEAKGHRKSGHREFRDIMVQNGVDERRISKMNVRGMNRLVPGTAVTQHSEKYTHEALVVDWGKESECVVDPSISVFAPVHHVDTPIDDQLASGETPYGDSPWVGTYDEYVNGGHMWWDEAEYSEWNE